VLSFANDDDGDDDDDDDDEGIVLKAPNFIFSFGYIKVG
jgi:hypothetical protein